MHPQLRFNVTPRLPEALEPLRELAFNLRFSWDAAVRKLFWRLDPALWDSLNHSPLRMLQRVSPEKLEKMAQDDNFLAAVERSVTALRSYQASKDTWAIRNKTPFTKERPVAYFSAEFGFHESVPIYSGGLGILSGDHTKSASDLGLPFVGVTLLYRAGYFKQQVNREGRQEAVALNQSFRELPIREAIRGGQSVTVSVHIADHDLHIKVWEMVVGRVSLYLLDTDMPENRPEDRPITAQLYGGDKEARIKQEIVLGIGGRRALEALGYAPQVFHMNEGHSAFLSLERIRNRMQRHNLDFSSAHQIVAASNVFTTHTPVPAGNEVFSVDLMRKYFSSVIEPLGITFERLMSLGQFTEGGNPNEFSMTILALRTSRHANGVSKIHGEVSRQMWANVWAGVPKTEVPITSVTNGVHTRTWLAPEIADLFNKHFGPDWDEHLNDLDYWRRVFDLPSAELWDLHQSLKNRLVEFARVRIRRQRERVNEPPEIVRQVNRLLDPEILTIGFARRFATYKRALLLFSQPERLLALINHPERPVQFIFAGKAHPHDGEGQEFIRQVIQFSKDPRFKNRVVFIEDYDACIGRRLYQGVDLWLNTPLRPLEASGTSGMKPPPNGGLNLSVLDGWWAEAWNRNNGWAIGEEIEGGDPSFQNEVDADSLYNILENQVVPLFYARPDGKLPLAWIQLMRESIRSVTPVFNTHRMVQEYTERLYMPAAKAGQRLAEDTAAGAKTLRDWKDAMRRLWEGVRIEDAEIHVADRLAVPAGEPVPVMARVQLGSILPEHVVVQAYLEHGESVAGKKVMIVDLRLKSRSGKDGLYVFEGSVAPMETGEFVLNVRVLPTHPLLTQTHELRLIRWL